MRLLKRHIEDGGEPTIVIHDSCDHPPIAKTIANICFDVENAGVSRMFSQIFERCGDA